ncbi:MAG: ion transporter [Chloroflexi bacterium]|nr:ion transporter [Chloroflexota bacterium]
MFILALSVLSLVNLVLDLFIQESALIQITILADKVLSLIFLADFLYRLSSAPSKKGYFIQELGWLDLLGSLPFPRIRILRLARIIRAVRLMRKYGLKHMLHQFSRDRAGSALYSVALLVFLMLEFGSMAMLRAELASPAANITTSEAAVWWSFVTMSTVGYGDFYPVTTMGRLVAVLFIIIGVGLFGVVTGFLANAFLGEEQAPEAEAAPEVAQLLLEIKRLQDNQQVAMARLEAKLNDLETAVQTNLTP